MLDTPTVYVGNHWKESFFEVFHVLKAFYTKDARLNSLLKIPEEAKIIPALYVYGSLSAFVRLFRFTEKDRPDFCRHKGRWIKRFNENGVVKLENRADVHTVFFTETKLGINIRVEK